VRRAFKVLTETIPVNPILKLRGQTQIGNIPQCAIYPICQCGHTGAILIAPLIKAGKAEYTVADILSKGRCHKCRGSGIVDFRISYIGGSAQALEGGEMRIPEKLDPI
jgi:hypothetical protein